MLPRFSAGAGEARHQTLNFVHPFPAEANKGGVSSSAGLNEGV